ncbi:MAG: hypothetical protein NVSMB19_11780 [Vulcanimicrobiaceae bacterium]
MLCATLSTAATPVSATLTTPERGALTRYLAALQHGDFTGAFAQLSADERRYFGSAQNLAAVYAADRFALAAFTIVGSTSAGPRGTIVVVRERVKFLDQAHQRPAAVSVNVRYGLVPGAHGPSVKDPFHPWFAFAPPPATASASANGVRVTIRKISFFTGRVELLATFANTGDKTVTILPYGRSVVRDDGGTTHGPVRSKLPGLTDKNLFEGLRLPPSGQYTGAMTFFTVDRFRPKRLSVVFAPALLDGADAPFELAVPEFAVPAAS